MRGSGPTAVDLFAGAGLFSFAFQDAGFEIVRAVESDSVAAATYARNVGDHVEVSDIESIEPRGRCDIIIAGPPCQGFSTLGTRRKDDPRNRLSLNVIRWAEKMRPRIVVVENVPSFLNSPVCFTLQRGIGALGYSIEALVLDAADFGVPQCRRRCFIVAWRTGKPFLAPTTRRRQRTVRDALDGLPDRPDGRNHHYSPKPSRVALARMRVIPTGGDKRDVMKRAPELTPPSWWRLSCEVTDAWGRMEWDKPANTLRTCFQNASKGRYIHPDQDRVISLREAARIHSIPDRWQFAGLPTQIARQIGNSVPPRLGGAVAHSALRLL